MDSGAAARTDKYQVGADGGAPLSEPRVSKWIPFPYLMSEPGTNSWLKRVAPRELYSPSL